MSGKFLDGLALAVIKAKKMKKSFLLFNLFVVIGCFQCRSQSLGFGQSECEIITDSSYYITSVALKNFIHSKSIVKTIYLRRSLIF